MVRRQEGLQGQAAGDGVLGMPDEPPAALGDAAHLAHELGERVQLVEPIAAGREQIDLVRGHQRAQRERIALDELHRPAVNGRLIVPPAVDAADYGVGEPQMLRPAGKHRHDRRAARGHADEIDRRPRGRLVPRVGRCLNGKRHRSDPRCPSRGRVIDPTRDGQAQETRLAGVMHVHGMLLILAPRKSHPTSLRASRLNGARVRFVKSGCAPGNTARSSRRGDWQVGREASIRDQATHQSAFPPEGLALTSASRQAWPTGNPPAVADERGISLPAG